MPTQFARFVVVNVLNTALYWALYLLFLLMMPYLVSNILALAVAVLVAYTANARYAFRVDTSSRTLLRYLVSNGTTVALRTAVVWVLVEVLSLAEQLAPPVAVAVTMPAAFILTRWAMGLGGQVPSGTAPVSDLPAAAIPALGAPR